jgi:cobalt-precorrin-7 (C5)-methyltransferase
MLYLIGVGPGDPEYLTIKGLNAIRRASLIAGWESVLSRFKDLIEGKHVIKITYINEAQVINELVEASISKEVVILNHGDPSVSDWQFVEKIKAKCREKGVKIDVVPGVSSVNAVLAREGLDLAKVVFITHHVRGEVNMEEIKDFLAIGRSVVLFPKPYPKSPQEIARFLISKGMNSKIKVYERLTFPSEIEKEYRAVDLMKEEREFDNMVVMVIYP